MLREHADAQGATDLAGLARSKALAGDVRAVEAARRAGGARRAKVETVERVCRMLLRVDPRILYGEAFDAAWQHRGRCIDARVAAFDLCCSSPKSVSLLAAGGGTARRAEVNGGGRPRWLPQSPTWRRTRSGYAASTTGPTATRPTAA